MDLGPPLIFVCVIMTCLLGAARGSNGDKTNCICPEILPLPLTRPSSGTCLQINDTFRYMCIGGYLRKVGTSNLIRCKEINGVANWTKPSLKCIPDPTRTTTKSPTTTVTKGHTDIPHDSIFTTTVTASTSLQMTQSISTSASVTVETESTEPTSPEFSLSFTSGKVYPVRETKATYRTTSTSSTAEPSNGTADPRVHNPTAITCGSLVIVCALIGISSFLCYRRRSQYNTPPHTTEEELPMNHGPSATVCSL